MKKEPKKTIAVTAEVHQRFAEIKRVGMGGRRWNGMVSSSAAMELLLNAYEKITKPKKEEDEETC